MDKSLPPLPWNYCAACQNNGANYWVIFSGRTAFGGTEVARTDSKEVAAQIVRWANAQMPEDTGA